MTTPRISRRPFGTLADGRVVEAITLSNANGVSATVITYGAALQALIMPDRGGNPADVQLGYPTIDGYLARSEYFGATVGRFANRIAGGRFTLDGRTHEVPVNDGVNALHGGRLGFDKALWEVVDVQDGETASVTLRHVSPDGDQGYPGTLTALATYTLDDGDALSIEYTATTNAPTIVNITNHAYWNLAGEGAPGGAMNHVLTIPAETFLPTDAAAIPTGEFRPVGGTPFDFREPRAVGDRVGDAHDEQIRFGRGYDHNFVIGDAVAARPRPVARLFHPTSGRGFDLLSNQPGLQLYSGNFLDGTIVGKSGRAYRQGACVVLEPQIFPDTPNRPAFGSARLAPGETYRNLIVYHLWAR